MTTRTISRDHMRQLAISAQLLNAPQHSATPDDIYTVAQRLGCLQLDPISAVTRSHLLVLWSRLGAFSLAALDQVIWQERRLFEYWAHCASLVLTEDYPIHHVMMRQRSRSKGAWAQKMERLLIDQAALVDHILDEIRKNGAMGSSHFQDESRVGWNTGGWTNGRNINYIIDQLWIRGELMVAGRKGTQRLWDLPERCLPAWTPREELPQAVVTRRAAYKALMALGAGTASHITQHFTRSRYPELAKTLKAMVKDGEIVPLQVEGMAGEWYLPREHEALLAEIEAGEWSPRTTLLSPFDNLICNRVRTEALFDFRFRIEIYVPKHKREYGYYVLPILHGDRLIGRIDTLMDRKAKVLNLNAVYVEPDTPLNAKTGRAVGKAARELADFLGADTVAVGETAPDAWRRYLGDSA